MNLEFLFRNIHTDLQILNATKDALDSRNSMYHSAITFANAFMNSGTTSDEFLRNNLEWLSRASNWSKFSATAALGVIHKVFFFSYLFNFIYFKINNLNSRYIINQ